MRGVRRGRESGGKSRHWWAGYEVVPTGFSLPIANKRERRKRGRDDYSLNDSDLLSKLRYLESGRYLTVFRALPITAVQSVTAPKDNIYIGFKIGKARHCLR
jgi:hypothetical protein